MDELREGLPTGGKGDSVRSSGFSRSLPPEGGTTNAGPALRRFEEEIDRFTAQPSGAGYELPGWLDALERELDQLDYEPADEEQEPLDPHVRLPQVRLSREEIRQQIERMVKEGPKWELGD